MAQQGLKKLKGDFDLLKVAGSYSTRDFTAAEKKTKVKSYFTAACDKWVTDIQTENATFYNSLIVQAGTADHIAINGRLAIGSKLEDLGVGSYLCRAQSRPKIGEPEIMFFRFNGVTYKLANREQAAAAYWILNKMVAIKHLE